MSLAEGVSARVAYKSYSTGLIQSNTQPISATDPGMTGAQTLRRVASTLKLAKDSYAATEIRSDRQTVDFRHGTRRVTGSITGEFSPGTYWDFFEAATRGTATPAVNLTEADLTSVAADATASTVTFGGGDPVSHGLHVGSVFQLGGLTGSGAPNNGVNFIAVGFSGPTNEIVEVFPEPTMFAAVTTFSLKTGGSQLIIPSTGFVSRKFAVETFHEDIGVSRLFTECRIGGFKLTLPASGLATVEFPMMGRDMEVFDLNTSTPAPFFTTPLPETTTGILAAVNGMLRVNGSVVGVVTGIDVTFEMSPSSDAVVGQDFVPEVFLGTAAVTGQVTAMLENLDLVRNFLDEDEVDILAYLTVNNDPGATSISLYLPRVKFSDADVAVQGLGSQTLTMPFTALKYVGSAPGVPQTTIMLTDSAAV
jgi:Phage tail tube protein